VEPPDLPGSIAEVSQRLLLWAVRQGGGLARVEYSSEFARQQVEQQLRTALAPKDITLTVVTLLMHQSAEFVIRDLLAQLEQIPAGSVVSVVGFTTAFDAQTPLADGLRVLNFNREALTASPLRQIWWMTPVLMQTAIHAMPDLQGWFSPQLYLREVVFADKLGQPEMLMDNQRSKFNLDDAYQRSRELLQQFEIAQRGGANEIDLLTTYLLPALECLAEVGAQKELQDLTSQFEGILGSLKRLDTPEMATSMGRLANLYREQGRYSEAEPLYKRSLVLSEHQLGSNHPDVATSLHNLAVLYSDQGRYSEAEPLYKRSLVLREHQLGSDHPDVAKSLNNLALLYSDQGRYSEVEPLYIRSLAIQEHQLGGKHLDVAKSLSNLASLYYAQGRYNEAESLFKRSLSIWERQLGANHPNISICLNNLAGVYYAQERYSETEMLLVRSLSILECQLGSEHPNVASNLNNLALLYDAQGRYSEAEPLYVRSLSIWERQLGADHPDVAISLNNLAGLYGFQGRHSAAEPLYTRAISIQERQLGAEHPDVATSLNNLAELYYAQERYNAAELLYARALEILLQKLGTEHPMTETIRGNFVACLQDAIAANQDDQLSDHPLTQAILAQLREEERSDSVG
jgi:tetratricopeptide (TPR) repeat protein